MSELRHTRQARLAEIGEAGQARLVASEVVVSLDGFAGDIEARYLAAAGVRVVRRSKDQGEAIIRGAEEPPFGITDPSAAELARGAHTALVRMRAILADTP